MSEKFNQTTKYIVEQVITNGYRCCCFQSWSRDPIECSTLEDAIEHLPTTSVPDLSKGNPLIDFELLESEILKYECWEEVDPETGDILEKRGDPEVVGWGRLDWPQTGKKSDRYKGSRWQGELQGTPFEIMERKLPPGTSENLSWANFIQNLKLDKDEGGRR
jgi:hypothetical protein